MTNTLELELQIKRIGISKKELAEKLGITEMSLFNKIKNITEFKASEIVMLTNILKLTCGQRDTIFLQGNMILNHIILMVIKNILCR